MEKDNKVTLNSADGEVSQLDASIASELEIVKVMIEDLGTEIGIPVPDISGTTLAKIAEYCGYHVKRPIQDIFENSHPNEFNKLPAIDDKLSRRFGEFLKEKRFEDRLCVPQELSRKYIRNWNGQVIDSATDQPSAEKEARFIREQLHLCVYWCARPIQEQIEAAVNQRLPGSPTFIKEFRVRLDWHMKDLIKDVFNTQSLDWWSQNDSERVKWHCHSYPYFMQIFNGQLQRYVLEEIREEVQRRFLNLDRVLLFDLIWFEHYFMLLD